MEPKGDGAGEDGWGISLGHGFSLDSGGKTHRSGLSCVFRCKDSLSPTKDAMTV